MRRLLDVMLSGATQNGGALELLPGKVLDESDRRAMQGRLLTLRRNLDHRDRSQARTTLVAFLASYGSNRGSESDAEMQIASYLAVMGDIPPWAIAEAARAWTRGGYGAVASAFAPSAAQFHEVAAAIVRPYLVEAEQLEAVLSARMTPISEAERARIAAGFDALVSDFHRRPTEEQKAESARQRYEAICAEAGIDPNAIPDATSRDGTFRKLPPSIG